MPYCWCNTSNNHSLDFKLEPSLRCSCTAWSLWLFGGGKGRLTDFKPHQRGRQILGITRGQVTIWGGYPPRSNIAGWLIYGMGWHLAPHPLEIFTYRGVSKRRGNSVPHILLYVWMYMCVSMYDWEKKKKKRERGGEDMLKAVPVWRIKLLITYNIILSGLNKDDYIPNAHNESVGTLPLHICQIKLLLYNSTHETTDHIDTRRNGKVTSRWLEHQINRKKVRSWQQNSGCISARTYVL